MATTKIYANYLEFFSREDKTENGVSESFAQLHPQYLADNAMNRGCWNCSDCSGCSGCSRCSGCSNCSRCFDCSRCSRCSGCSNCSRLMVRTKQSAERN